MNFLFWTLVVACFQAAIGLSVTNHTCAPSGYTKICILDSLHYKSRATELVIHNFPQNQSHIRIVSDSRSTGRFTEVLDIDINFYDLIGRPAILEIFDHDVWNLQIPRALRRGKFPLSNTRNLTVEPGTDSPALIYLDLTYNLLSNISNVKSLVNLEVLLLSYNLISNIDALTFKNLTRLRYLDLSFNDLSTISLGIFPKSLTHLDLYACRIISLNYDELYYPSLEMLNIEANKLTSIDGSALMLAMPKLNVARIGRNNFERDDENVVQTVQLFRRHNISLRNEADDVACWRGDIGGVCLAEPESARTMLYDILMSLLVILVAIALVGMLRWVFTAMNRKYDQD